LLKIYLLKSIVVHYSLQNYNELNIILMLLLYNNIFKGNKEFKYEKNDKCRSNKLINAHKCSS